MKTLIAGLILFCSSANAYVSFSELDEIYLDIVNKNGYIFYPELILNTNGVMNAAGVGPYIIIFSGVIPFLRNKDEAAVLLGHELAHSKLGHLASTPHNEYEADRYGAAYAKKAGYNPCEGVKMFLRFGAGSETHPSGVSRYKQLRCDNES